LVPDDSKAKAGLKQATYAQAMAQGQKYATQGKFPQAADEFRKALAEKPSDTMAQLYLDWANNAGSNGPSMPFRKR